MATIAAILIRVISLLGKQKELTREVFWWLVVGREHLMFFFPQKKLKMSAGRWWCSARMFFSPFPPKSSVFLVQQKWSSTLDFKSKLWPTISREICG
jgi:hypothetical protein